MRLSGKKRPKGLRQLAADARFRLSGAALITAEVPDRDHTLRFVCRTRRELLRAATLYTKEPETVALMRDEIRAGDVVWDVGANIGLYSLIAATRVGDAGAVYAFEPMAENFARLIENILVNKFESRITPLSVALSGDNGFLPFHYDDASGGASGSQLRDALDYQGRGFRPVLTEIKCAATGDELLARGALRRPDVIKIDVDGHEGDILHGMRGVMSEVHSRPRLVAVELAPRNHEPAETLMRELGYELTDKQHTRSGARKLASGTPESDLAFNAIFRPRTA